MQRDHRSLHEQQQQQQQQQHLLQSTKSMAEQHKLKQKKFAQQRSILKNSIEQQQQQNNEDQELIEAKKLIMRRRRLFSHYRQYEQWRRRQFSYDPCYYRATPLPIGQAGCGDYGTGYTSYSGGSGAFRRRRQYRRQFSCAERSREDSRESRESSSLYKYKCQSMMASDTINTDSSNCNQPANNSHNSVGRRSRAERPSHFHMLQEERSASISERCTRSRINSAIFVSSEGRGFDSIEFLRRHGSQSVLCRKARSAENITDNERKKSFAENKRPWCTDEVDESDTNAYGNANDSSDGNAIELQECGLSVSGASMGAGAACCLSETRTLPVLTTTTTTNSDDYASTSAAAACIVNGIGKHGHTAAVTTASMVVGSISLETPPAHIKDEFNACASANANCSVYANTRQTSVSSGSGSGCSERRARPTNFAGMSSKSSASHDSTDTVEELVLVPTAVATAAVSSVAPEVRCSRPRILVRQRTSNRGVSPQQSPNRVQLSLTGVRPKVAAALPMVSVSGPTPPQEKPLPQPQSLEAPAKAQPQEQSQEQEKAPTQTPQQPTAQPQPQPPTDCL